MSRPNPALFALYRRALVLYPAHVRTRNQAQMLQTVRDADAERSYSAARFWLYLFTDLLQSVAQENLLMVRSQFSARPIFFHAVILGIILTGMGGAASLVFQQMLRRGANQPQIQMAETGSSALSTGSDPHSLIPASLIDVAQSLEPFAVFYSDSGAPVTSSGYLDDAIPVPPTGVFAFVRNRGEDRITWQPQPGVRIAAVIQRVGGSHPGFILAGRSLRVVEEQEDLFWKMVFGAWLALVVLLMVGATLLARAQIAPTAVARAQG